MLQLSEEQTRNICDILGYLNFSSGSHEAHFYKSWNSLFHFLRELHSVDSWHSSEEWRQARSVLSEELVRLSKSGQAAFQDSRRAQTILDFVYDRLLPAYLEFHSDTLFKKSPNDLFNSFFLARCCELTLSLTGSETKFDDLLVANVIRQLNDFLGYRPIPILEGEDKHEPDPHEWIAPLSLYRKEAGTACGRYQRLVELTLKIIRQTDPNLLREAWFDPDKLDELVMDPRNYDFDHPVNRRPNYSFGTWDPHCIDQDGFYRRFLVHQVTVEGMIQRAELYNPDDFPDGATQDMLLYEAASVLAGTMLMGSGVTGDHVQAHDSTVSLSTLMPLIANYRDTFYAQLIKQVQGKHQEHLLYEEARLFQPFAGARQSLNKYLAKQRADQLQRYHLARTYARMGYFDAAKEQTDIIAVASARLVCKIDCCITEAYQLADRKEIHQAAEMLAKIEETLRRGIACGALPDPWTLLGFGAEYSLFSSAENTIHDHRLDDLINLMNDIFDLFSRLQKEAAVHGDGELQADLSDKMSSLAGWWDQFGSDEISGVEGFSGLEVWESAAKVSTALAAWHKAGTAAGDVAFWQRHVQRFTSPKAFVILCEALLDQNDLVASMALIIYWLAESGRIPLQEGDYSLHSIMFRWMQQLWQERDPSGRYRRNEKIEPLPLDNVTQNWDLMIRFIDRVEANADSYWNVPTLDLDPALLDEDAKKTIAPQFICQQNPAPIEISVTPENNNIQISVDDFWKNVTKKSPVSLQQLGNYTIQVLRTDINAVQPGDLDKTFLDIRAKELQNVPDNLQLPATIALSLFNDWISLVRELISKESESSVNDDENMLELLRPLETLNFDIRDFPDIDRLLDMFLDQINDNDNQNAGKNDQAEKSNVGKKKKKNDENEEETDEDSQFYEEFAQLKNKIFNHFFNWDDEDDEEFYDEDQDDLNKPDDEKAGQTNSQTKNEQKNESNTSFSEKYDSFDTSNPRDLQNKNQNKKDSIADQSKENTSSGSDSKNPDEQSEQNSKQNCPSTADNDNIKSTENENDNEDEDDTKKGIDSTFKAAYDNMTYQDSAEDGVDDEMMESGASGSFGSEDSELSQETERINDRLTFIYSLVKLWKYAAGKSLQLSSSDQYKENVRFHLTAWLNQACIYKLDLETLLSQTTRIHIPRPSGTPDSLIEYDQARGTKEILLDRIIWSIVDVSDAILFLEAILNDEPDDEAIKANSPRVQIREGIIEFAVMRDTLSAVFRRDVDKVQKLVPKLFRSFSTRTLLYIPTTRGGRSEDIVACRCLQQIVLRFLEYLPRLGLVTETCRLLRTVQVMEQIRPPMPGAITEFDRIFETAARSLTKTITESSKKWRFNNNTAGPMKTTDDALVEYARNLNDILLSCWLSHSQHIRISTVESFQSFPQWERIMKFVVQYGEDLLTQHFLSFRNLRAILHQGVETWVRALIRLKKEDKQIEFGEKLIDDIIANRLEIKNAVAFLEMIFECIAENYSEYIDYNSVTTHSDHGEKTYIFLDMLRVLAAYERYAWNFKPVYWIHDTMIRNKCFTAAELSAIGFDKQVSKVASEMIKKYNDLSEKYGVWLPSINERIQERFVRPLQIDQMCGLVGQALEDVRSDKPVGAFKELEKRVEEFTKSPMGIGFELPEWLSALQEEMMIFQVNAEKSNERVTDEDILNPTHIFKPVQLTRSELASQLRYCRAKMNFQE